MLPREAREERSVVAEIQAKLRVRRRQSLLRNLPVPTHPRPALTRPFWIARHVERLNCGRIVMNHDWLVELT